MTTPKQDIAFVAIVFFFAVLFSALISEKVLLNASSKNRDVTVDNQEYEEKLGPLQELWEAESDDVLAKLRQRYCQDPANCTPNENEKVLKLLAAAEERDTIAAAIALAPHYYTKTGSTNPVSAGIIWIAAILLIIIYFIFVSSGGEPSQAPLLQSGTGSNWMLEARARMEIIFLSCTGSFSALETRLKHWKGYGSKEAFVARGGGGGDGDGDGDGPS